MEFSLCTMGLQGLQVWVLILATNMYEQVPQGVAVTVDSIAVSSWKLLWETKNLNRLYLQHCYANDVARHANATAFAFDFAVVSVADRYRSLCCLYLGRLHIIILSYYATGPRCSPDGWWLMVDVPLGTTNVNAQRPRRNAFAWQRNIATTGTDFRLQSLRYLVWKARGFLVSEVLG